MVATEVGVRHKECCDCYRDKLRTTRDAVGGYKAWLRTTNVDFCGNLVRLRIHRMP